MEEYKKIWEHDTKTHEKSMSAEQRLNTRNDTHSQL